MADGAAKATRQARIGSALVGRHGELGTLAASIESLCAGRGGVTVLFGEPGAGKSRLVAEARRRAQSRNLRCLEGRAQSFGRGLSYWPFIDVLKDCFSIADSDSEAVGMDKLERAVRPLFGQRADEIVPYVAAVLALQPGAPRHLERLRHLDAQALGRQVFFSLYQLFGRLAQHQPLLLVMEDWHWVDQSSVALCEHLLALTGSAALAFWFVSRAEPGEPAARIEAAARRAALPLRRIELSALTYADGRALIDNMLGHGELPEPMRGAILRKTAGNPFFIEEMVRGLIADGSLARDTPEGAWRLAKPLDALRLPDDVEGAIVAHIERLDEAVTGVLKLASIIGRSFFLRVLHGIADSGADVTAALARLERADLIRLRHRLPEREYAFKHALVQEVAYAGIVAAQRRALHRRVAQVTETLFADRLDEFAGLLAYHYALAEDWPKAQDYLFRAGDQAGRMAADAEALEHYRQAEKVYLGVPGHDLEPMQRAVLDRKLGQALYGVGLYEPAVEHFSRALAQLGVRYPTSRAGIRWSTMKYLAAHGLRRLGAHGLRRRRLDLATAREISTICRCLGWLDYFVDEDRLGLDSMIELDVGERSGDALGHARGLTSLGVAMMTFALFSMSRRCLDEAEAIATEPDALGPAHFVRGWLLWQQGELPESARLLERSASAYGSIGDIRGRAGPIMMRFWVAFHQADLGRAADHAEDLVRTGKDSGDNHVLMWGIYARGVLRVTTGPLDEAATCVSTTRALCIENSVVRGQVGAAGVLARCRLLQGRLDEAEALLSESLALIESRHLRGAWSAEPFNGFAELCLLRAALLAGSARLGALRESARACARALRCAKVHAAPWLPEALRLCGRLDCLRGRRAAAHRRWQASLHEAERVGLPIERARTLLMMGEHLSDVARVDEAVAVFDACGARVDAAFALHVAAALHARLADPAAALSRYDAAIAALRAVGAPLRLRTALDERAQLQRQTAGFASPADGADALLRRPT